MTIHVECSECGKALRLRDEAAGKRTRCAGCEAWVSVPKTVTVPLPRVKYAAGNAGSPPARRKRSKSARPNWLLICGATAALAFVVFLGTPLNPLRSVLLSWKFKQGESLHYSIVRTITLNPDDPQLPAMNARDSTDVSWSVEEVDPSGSAKLRLTYDSKRNTRIGKEADAGMRDGANAAPAGNPFSRTFQSQRSSTQSVTMRPTGRMEVFSHPAPHMPHHRVPPDPHNHFPPGSPHAPSFESEFIGEKLLGLLPEGAVRFGSSWSNETSSNITEIGKVSSKITYTYRGSELRQGRWVEVIGVKIESRTAAEGSMADKMKIISHAAEGTIYFDNAAGRLVESTEEHSIVMTMSNKGKDMTQKVTLQATTKLVE